MMLAAIKSPSGNEKEIVEKVSSILLRMGLDVNIDQSGKHYGSNSGNITAFSKGSSSSKNLSIFLGAHLDTVSIDGEIVPVIKNGIISNKNTYILGGDDKVAVAAILEVLRTIKEKNIKTGDIYLIFTVSEEIGVAGVPGSSFYRDNKSDKKWIRFSFPKSDKMLIEAGNRLLKLKK